MSAAASARGTAFRCRHILPMAGPALEDGWLRVARGRIVALGRGRPPAGAIDLGAAIVLPGLVNAHTHLEFSGLQAPLDASGGLPGWIGRIVRLRRERDAAPGAAEQVAAALRGGLAESALAGVTTIGEIATQAHVASVTTSGPRLRTFREALGLSAAAGDAAFRSLSGDLDRLAANAAAAGLSPHAPYSVAAPLGRRLVAEARRRRLPVAMHVAESLAEQELLTSGTGPLRRLLEELGVWRPECPPHLLPAAEWITRLARAPRGIIVHGTFLDRDTDAFGRLARHRDRLGVVVCPRTTQALSGTLPPVALFREAGIHVAIGTDSRASNPDLSVLAECRALVAAGAASPAEALRMATIHGAWALAFERRCGRLSPGLAADLVILRPAADCSDPWEAALDPGTRIAATMRAGRFIAGEAREAGRADVGGGW